MINLIDLIKEAENSVKIMTGVRKGSQSGPWTIVVSRNRKVAYQRVVKTKDELPANIEAMKITSALSGDVYTIEDNTGRIVYSEKI